jgi:hypothetical protein
MKRRWIIWPGMAALVAVAFWIGSAYAAVRGNTKPQKGVGWAVVGGTGTLGAHSKSVIGASESRTGSYTVTLKGTVTSCAATVTIHDNGGGGQIASDFLGSFVRVYTYSPTGVAENRPFSMMLMC